MRCECIETFKCLLCYELKWKMCKKALKLIELNLKKMTINVIQM